MDTFLTTLPKKIATKQTGIYYKEIEKTIIDDTGKTKTSICDKMYYIRYKDEHKKDIWVAIGKYSNGISEAYCLTKRTQLLNQLKLGEQPNILKKKMALKKDTVTLEQIFDIYLEQKRLLGQTHRKVGQVYKVYLHNLFGKEDIHDITTDKIVKFKQFLVEKNLSASTINSNIAFLGTLFNLAIEEKKYTQINPTKDKMLKPLKLDNARDRYLNTSEINQLLNAVTGDDAVELFTRLSLSTGGRLETILNIKAKDINLQNSTVTLKDLKSNKTYTGFLSLELINILSTLSPILEPNSYIVGGGLEKFSVRIIQRHLKEILDSLFNVGLDQKDTKNRVVVHTLRHTFASHLAINGTPIFTIQKLTNHSDIAMTMRYAKLAPDSGKVAVQGLYRVR